MAAEADDFDVDDWLSGYTPKTAEARLWRNDLLKAHAAAERALASHPGPDESKALAERLAAIEAEADETAKVFAFRALSALAWADLIGKHPPTKEQHEADAELDHNPETFPTAAVAASSLSPRLTVEQAERIRGTVQSSEWQKLWGATLEANIGTLAAFPKSALGAAILRLSSNGSGTTAAPGASLAASSSGGVPTTSAPPSNGKQSRTPAAQGAANRATRRSRTKS